jgi:hypothetical protein
MNQNTSSQFTAYICLHSDVQDVKEQNSATISPMQQQKKQMIVLVFISKHTQNWSVTGMYFI